MSVILASSLSFAPFARADDAPKKVEAKASDSAKKEMKDMDDDCDCKECKKGKKDHKGHKDCAHCKMHHHDQTDTKTGTGTDIKADTKKE